jgi:hypothetical protein
VSLEDDKRSKAWLVWTYDPCPEGGWHIAHGHDTQEEAIAAAKELHEKETKKLQERKEQFEARGRKLLFTCYAEVMVTPGQVFSMELESL